LPSSERRERDRTALLGEEGQSMISSRREYTPIDLHALNNRRVACLTMDVEQDYGDLLDEPTYEGLEHIPEFVNFFKERNVPLTCFVQGSLLETHPDKIEQLFALGVEIELHSYSHRVARDGNAKYEIERGKEAYLKFFSKAPMGYRAPVGIISEQDYEILAANGFKFDSSILPSLRPGAFNHLRKPTKPYLISSCGIAEFPLTVFSPVVRIPVVLSYIKLLGKPYLHLLKTFNLPSFVVFCFHLHDLFELDSANRIPLEEFSPLHRLVFKRIYQKGTSNGLALLDKLITVFQQKGYLFSKLESITTLLFEGK
jgi:peptidoglycan/xylan/chitin deacetylase (PgdA/CDA1 family)